MINIDAINILKNIQNSMEETDFLSRCALDMAIEALKENESLAKSVIEASELLRKKRPHGEWIPCSERLPERNDEKQVLVTVSVPNPPYRIIVIPVNSVRQMYKQGHISAWMPLPKPYEGSDEK